MRLAFLALSLGITGCTDAVPDVGLAHPDAPVESHALSTPPARPGNRAQLLINGESSFATRMRLLAAAQRSIHIQALIWKGDETGWAIAEALIAKKKAQPDIDIRVIVDAYSNIQDLQAQLLYFEMQNAGIRVEGYEAFYLQWLNEIDIADAVAGNKRYHEKYWIVDGVEAVVGGMNIADEYARCSDDPTLTWRDQDVALAGPVVADVEAAFEDNFAQLKAVKAARPELLDPDAYWRAWRERTLGLDEVVGHSLALRRRVAERLAGSGGNEVCAGTPVRTQPADAVTVQFVRSRPREGERNIHALYLGLVGGARRSVLIENAYFVPPADLVAALVDAAHRGVSVRVVNNSPETNDIPMINTAGRARYRTLIDAGVEVYEWHGERHGEGTLHAKLAVVDDAVAVVGSYNLDPRSLNLNSEDVVAIQDPRIAAELAGWAAAHDLPWAERITPEQAIAWAAPGSEAEASPLPAWDPRTFDRKTVEYALLRRVEGGL